jgi:hypothetical protein
LLSHQKNNGHPTLKEGGLNSPLFLGSSKAHLHTEVWSFRLIFEDKTYDDCYKICEKENNRDNFVL